MKTAASCYEIVQIHPEDERYFFVFTADTPYVRAIKKVDLKTA